MTTQDNEMLARLVQGCESEQLHLSGAIQPFGAMLRIDAETLRITHASANLAEFTGIPAADILGHAVDDTVFISSADLARLPEQSGKTTVLANAIENASSRIDALLIRGDGCILVELERNDAPAEPITVQSYQRPLMRAPHDAEELAEYHQTLLRAFREITGYERILVYRFQHDWAGEVIAELTTAGAGSYLGLRFPASDIPAIARELYLINPSRMIPDAMATAVPVLGIDGQPPDLSRSNLRSVSPVHLQYLANMGVGASFSVPVRVSGKLWALAVCNHHAPRPLSPDQRNACVTLAGAYASGVTSHLASRRLQMVDSLQRRIEGVLEVVSGYPNPLDGIEANGQELIDALAAKGFAMALGQEVIIAGDGPGLDEIGIIDRWFLEKCKESVFSTDCLASIFPEKVEILATVSGMMAIKAHSVRSGWIRFYWFRPAEPQEVAWAGNPNKPVVENAGAAALSPRRSFERWVETKSGYSRRWSDEERLVAGKFRNHLLQWL